MPRITCGQKLSGCEEEAIAASISVPLNRAIESLCLRAEETGVTGQVSRKEMLAAILYSVTGPNAPDPERLVEMLQEYRLAAVEGHLPDDAATRGYHDFEERKPGRPRRR
jgi:hypothetical protein